MPVWPFSALFTLSFSVLGSPCQPSISPCLRVFSYPWPGMLFPLPILLILQTSAQTSHLLRCPPRLTWSGQLSMLWPILEPRSFLCHVTYSNLQSHSCLFDPWLMSIFFSRQQSPSRKNDACFYMLPCLRDMVSGT